MFLTKMNKKDAQYLIQKTKSRNPLKSGQCFLPWELIRIKNVQKFMSQSPQIGSMFLTLTYLKSIIFTKQGAVAIPSNRVNVSYEN